MKERMGGGALSPTGGQSLMSGTTDRYGQLSGMVEPVAGALGAAAITVSPSALRLI